ncbi:uncharacterized protein LOC129409376 isoform X2 [Boleophthalmus pectinirostris]|uniref:uncharacterized protein LOC129409376 isoform X2 n=1 Tax=Boleophthalmus pectinirostris TaxID=150288 RepID=UPI002430684A|nr:uncharacterized protein LOC129409376 isoform X2 [Boleophthalmus pectinirostris]
MPEMCCAVKDPHEETKRYQNPFSLLPLVHCQSHPLQLASSSQARTCPDTQPEEHGHCTMWTTMKAFQKMICSQLDLPLPEARSRLLLRASGSRGTAIISTIIRTTRGRPRPHPHLSTHTPAPTPNRTGRAGGTEAGRLGSPQDRASRRLFHETVRSAGMLLQRGDHYSPMWTINRLNISHALQRSDTSPTALSNHMAFDYQLIKEDPIRAQPIQYLMYSV